MAVPVVDVSPRAIALDAIALLNLAFQLVAFAGNLIKVVVGEFAPLLLDALLDWKLTTAASECSATSHIRFGSAAGNRRQMFG
ncbi:hypothetical protein FHT77_000927 [Rhizobium sp. BK181]|nr:hypothetical protein [Rhizobium sp. BK181]